VRGENHSKVQDLGTTNADALGGARFTFRIPEDAEAGSHEVFFFGTLDGKSTQASVKYKVSRGRVGTNSTDNANAAPPAAPPAAGPPAAEPPAAAGQNGPGTAGSGSGVAPAVPHLDFGHGVLQLPRTGAALISFGAAGVGALLLGAALVLAGRRRRYAAIAASVAA
jgi:LPXTG-motif cell wall-anchored protein